jgi:hypothetical protein
MLEAGLRLCEFEWDHPYLHLELRASNGRSAATQDFYCLLDALEEFGRELTTFPSSVTSETSLEAGQRDPRWAHHVLLRAYVYDSRGHTALEVELADRAVRPYGQEVRFSIVCEAASLNRLGKELLAWCRDREHVLEWHPTV